MESFTEYAKRRNAEDKVRQRLVNAAVACADELYKAVKIVLSLHGKPPVSPNPEVWGCSNVPIWVVKLDPVTFEHLTTWAHTYENMIQE